MAPAKEPAALYHERWEIETALDELKTHLRGAQIVLRSKAPELVEQEFYGKPFMKRRNLRPRKRQRTRRIDVSQRIRILK